MGEALFEATLAARTAPAPVSGKATLPVPPTLRSQPTGGIRPTFERADVGLA